MHDNELYQGVPRPGSVFREYPYSYRSWVAEGLPPQLPQIDPDARSAIARELQAHHPPEAPAYLYVDDLGDATGAELCIEYWGGHIGSSLRGFRVNGSRWLDIPQPPNTPSAPECYYRTYFGNHAAPVPLEHLREGVNVFQFGAGPQIKYDFGCGFYWVYSFTLRVYYSPARPHPSGVILRPASGEKIADHTEIMVQARSPNGPIAVVDLLGCYEDFSWSGYGLFRDWHFQYRYGLLTHGIGRAIREPFCCRWNTTWVPDQSEPLRIMARIVDAAGWCAMTQLADGLELKREGRSVRMFKPLDIPEDFGVRVGQRKVCSFDVNRPPAGAREARLLLSTWSAAHADEIGLNDYKLVDRIGKVHDVSIDAIPVPPTLLREGRNTFHIYATTEEHAAEVNWPGPVLQVIYE
ncbi:MAG: hypothetical protein QME94_12345 [Anaerolineae bacterium]|nr:hypothetical protein [Anaerolineae bacterium]